MMMTERHILASRARSLPQSSTVRIADLAAAMRARGEAVIDLSAGRAAEATPWLICDEAKAALDDGDTHQTPARGQPNYLRAVAEKLERENGLRYDPDTGVMATLGCKNGLVLALMSILDPGDEVIVEDPCFVSYAPTIALCGGVAVPVPVRAEDKFRWTAGDLEAAVTSRTKAILFCSPHNPLGVVHDRNDLEIIADAARTHHLTVIADEIYEAVTWEGRKHLPIASLEGMAERTIGLMGMTKSYSMGGWRIGYAYAPPEIIAQMTMVQGHFMTCASSINQRAGAKALSAEVANELRQTTWRDWESRCQYMARALDEIDGLSCEMPEGGFYVWLDIRNTGLASETFSRLLLSEFQVATVPGGGFSPLSDDRVRVTCVKSRKDIETAAARIAEMARGIASGQLKDIA